MDYVTVPLRTSVVDGTVVERPGFRNHKLEESVTNTYMYICDLPSCHAEPARKLPIILPHVLFGHLSRHGLLPRLPTAEYWEHMKQHASWGQGPHRDTDPDVVPCFLYGDDTKYNQQEKLSVIMVGMVLDPRRSSMMTHYPLGVLKEVAWLFQHPCNLRGLLSLVLDIEA